MSRAVLRTRAARGLLAVALALSLVLGAAVLVLTDKPSAAPEIGLPDDAAAASVVSAARGIVSTAGLRQAAGGYAFLPCGTGDGPPYQATLHLTFTVPQANPVAYLAEVSDRLIAAGWTEGLKERLATKLTRDGLVALLERDRRRPGFATATVYGPCRVTTDHRRDDPAWTDVTF
ncbi:hypothetical protein [Mycolicibacterium phlei]